MIPLIIITEDKAEITLKTDQFRKYIEDAYSSGYTDGYDKGKCETKPYEIGIREIGTYYDNAVTCNATNDELHRGK